MNSITYKSVAEQKNELRKRARLVRSAIDEKTIIEISELICESIASLPEFTEADALFCYSALNGEILTDSLVNIARSYGKAVAFPKCREGGKMDFMLVRDSHDMSVGAFGIIEPKDSCKIAFPSDFRRVLCILPGLVFGRDGHRIGYGKGFYDRYFENKTDGVTLLGICPHVLVEDFVPHGEFDVRADIIVSEKEVVRIEKA